MVGGRSGAPTLLLDIVCLHTARSITLQEAIERGSAPLQADHVSLYSLALAPDQEPSVTRLAALNIDSRVVDICATSPEDNEQTLVAVTRPGGVHVLRLTLPDDWQGSLEATQVGAY